MAGSGLVLNFLPSKETFQILHTLTADLFFLVPFPAYLQWLEWQGLGKALERAEAT